MVAVHRWLGLTAGLVLVVLALSGGALVFREEIDRALNPHLLRVVPAARRAPLQGAVVAAGAAFPGERPSRVRMPRTGDGTYEVWLGPEPSRYVYVDPYRGTVLGARRPTEFLTGALFRLHTTLFAGSTGAWVAGACALGLVLLGGTGLVGWWPGRGRLRPALTVAWRASRKRVLYDLHRSAGFYASGFLVLAGVTGASLVFHDAFRDAIYWLARTPAAPTAARATSPAHLAPLPLDRLLRAAEQAQPGGTVSYLYLPTGPRDPLRVRKRLPPELHPNGKTFIDVDPRTATVLGVENGATAPLGGRVYSALYPLHIGVVGGTATRVLAVGVAVTPALFFATGLAMWRARRHPRAAGSRAPAGSRARRGPGHVTRSST